MTETIVALLLFLFPLAFSPGPGNMLFAANGALFGFRATLPASAGYHLATWVVTAAIGLGCLNALETWPLLFPILKTAGALYVVWLAIRLWRAKITNTGETARPMRVLDGAALLILNPKAYIIIALMFSTFLPASETSVLTAVFVLTTVFTLNNLLAFSAWTVIGDRLSALFRSKRHAAWLNRSFAVVLVGVAGWMALS
ncbi:LysE family translocator [Marivita sp. XM-24bin2]|uniref:LysE family translocator n=1 Tax=unclassified Marivita TaxID=2632480 RepID=UPI000D7A8E62|nr:LysE family translocator [Marivita sp. XM-24bin2]MCR9111026.1 LysE family translocator [Paracoccaceae bacterium]PWL28315.1 MAG: lysine transporter LysE [Marivita sp. XM-24bin2]